MLARNPGLPFWVLAHGFPAPTTAITTDTANSPVNTIRFARVKFSKNPKPKNHSNGIVGTSHRMLYEYPPKLLVEKK